MNMLLSPDPSPSPSTSHTFETDSTDDCCTAHCCKDSFDNFLSNARRFFSNLWHYKLELGLGILNIAGGLVFIFLVDLPTFFGSEAITKGLPFFMIGSGAALIVSAFLRAAADTRNYGNRNEMNLSRSESISSNDIWQTAQDQNKRGKGDRERQRIDEDS